MGDPRASSQEIIGIEVARSVVRGVRVQPDRNEIVGVAEVPYGPAGLDRDGVMDPAVLGRAFETLLFRIGLTDRSQARYAVSIGPRNSGVGSGPAMGQWLEAQAVQLRQPLVCAGGLGVAFAPIRAIDHAVKTAFEIGIELTHLDLAPVAAARAIGDQVDDLICLGSGRGWQARMRDFEVLEAMENPRIGPDEPVYLVGRDGMVRPIGRYGWIDFSIDLQRAGRIDLGRFAMSSGAALGILYSSPTNLLDGRVVGTRALPSGLSHAPPDRAGRRQVPMRADQTLQLGVIDASMIEAAAGTDALGGPEVARHAGPVSAPGPGSGGGATRAVARAGGVAVADLATDGGAGRDPATGADGRFAPGMATGLVEAPERGRRPDGWDGVHLTEDDPINLFSPDTDEANILGRRRFGLGMIQVLVLLAVLAAVLAAAYRFL